MHVCIRVYSKLFRNRGNNFEVTTYAPRVTVGNFLCQHSDSKRFISNYNIADVFAIEAIIYKNYKVENSLWSNLRVNPIKNMAVHEQSDSRDCWRSHIRFKGTLNTDTSPQNFWTTFLDNDSTEKFKKSAVANAIAIPLPLCFSCFVPSRRFRNAEKTWSNHFISISLTLVTLPALLRR